MARRTTLRILTLLAASSVASALVPSAAHAAPPAPGGTYSFPAGSVCAFPITYHEDVNSEVTRDHRNYSITTGQYKVTVSNDLTGASLSLNVVGPGLFRGDTLTAVGPWLFLLGPGEVYGPGLFLLTGRTTVKRDPDTGLITTLTTTGSVSKNLCSSIS